jgi:hypothetical protein
MYPPTTNPLPAPKQSQTLQRDAGSGYDSPGKQISKPKLRRGDYKLGLSFSLRTDFRPHILLAAVSPAQRSSRFLVARPASHQAYPSVKTAAACEMEPVAAMRKASSQASLADPDDFDLTRLLNHKPRINVERQRSFDDRSLSEISLPGAAASRGGWGYYGGAAGVESYESMYSPGGGLRSYCGTPASSTRLSFEPHPLVGEAWDALRRSLVSFRGQPLGTIAAVDHSTDEVLNYDQVRIVRTCVCATREWHGNGMLLPSLLQHTFVLSCVLVAFASWVVGFCYADRSRYFSLFWGEISYVERAISSDYLEERAIG